jgi:predicted nucleic acid-binding protein
MQRYALDTNIIIELLNDNAFMRIRLDDILAKGHNYVISPVGVLSK